MSVDLSKYLKMAKENYTTVYSDTLQKKYDAGWVSYVLPREMEYCDSPRSKDYGIEDEKTAVAFWKNKLLRTNYVRLISLITDTMTVDEFKSVFTPRAIEKIKFSLDLFLPIAENLESEPIVLHNFVDKYYA